MVVTIFRVSSKDTGFVLQRLEALLLLLGHQVVTKVCLVSCSTEWRSGFLSVEWLGNIGFEERSIRSRGVAVALDRGK